VVPAALLGIVAVAIVLRFVVLASNPGGLYPDEAAEGLDAQRLLHQPGFHPVFFADDGGREALFAYVVAGAFRLAGETPLVLRATAAGFGVAGVVAIWLLGRRFGTLAGLAAGAWAAGSLWLVCVSRDGMRNTIVPLFGALALLALLNWAERRSTGAAVLAGAATALASLYTYQPLKLLPLLVLLWLLWLRRVDRPAYDRLRAGFVPIVVAFCIVGAPMIAAAMGDPANYFGRAVGVTPLNPEVESDSSLVVHVLRTLGMFAITGDPNARQDVAGLPLLGWPLTLVAVAGLARLWRRRGDAGHALILLSLPVFLAAPLVAVEGGSPHFLRALGLAAPLGVTIGLGVTEIVDQVRRRWGPVAARGAVAVAAAGLLVLAGGSGWAYLTRPVADRYDAYTDDLSAMAAAARAPRTAVILGDYDATVVRFLDAAALPAIVAPGTRIATPTAYARVLARSVSDLTAAVGPSVAARSIVIERDPSGRPRVWAVRP